MPHINQQITLNLGAPRRMMNVCFNDTQQNICIYKITQIIIIILNFSKILIYVNVIKPTLLLAPYLDSL